MSGRKKKVNKKIVENSLNEYSDSDEDCDLEQPSINIALHIHTSTNPRKRTIEEMESLDRIESEQKHNTNNDHNHNNNKSKKPPLKKQRSELDMNKVQTRQCSAGNSDLKYWTIHPGLNYYGVPIHKPQCNAWGQQVSIHRGFGNANVIKDINMRKCPDCQAPFELSGVVMYQCKATAQFQFGDNNPLITKNYFVFGNNYIDFGEQQKMDQKEVAQKRQKALNKETEDVNDNRISNYKVLQFDVKPNPMPQPQFQPQPQYQYQTQTPRFILPQPQQVNVNRNYYQGGQGINYQQGNYYNNTVYNQTQQPQQINYNQTQPQPQINYNNNIYNQTQQQQPRINYNQTQPQPQRQINYNSNNINIASIIDQQREQQKLQMARNIVSAYSGKVTLEQVKAVSYDRVKALHDEIIKRLNATNSTSVM